MNKELEFFIGIPVPNPWGDLVSQNRKKAEGRDILSSPPHVTLIPPFKFENKLKLIKKLNSFNYKPFFTVWNNIAVFRHKKYATIVLLLDDPSFLQNFYKELVSNLLEVDSSTFYKNIFYKKYQPHITLANKILYKDLSTNLKKFRGMNLNLKFEVSSIALYSRNSFGPWAIYKEFNLSML